MAITAIYVHPQGKRVEVHSNGALVCTKNGKKATTSATAEKLAAGYGGWTLVEGGDVESAAAAVALPPAKSVARVLRPMRFAEAPVADLPRFVEDPAWALQQKLDGVRAQLVFSTDAPPWFRNSSGERLSHAAVAPVANAIMAAFADQLGLNAALDGELVGGAFYAFDLVVEGAEARPYRDRLDDLQAFLAAASQVVPQVRLLRTAVTYDEKAALGFDVLHHGGEGWIAKRLDSPYEYGARVEHSLKLKVTSTIDCVIIEKDPTKDAVRLGCYDEVGMVEVGRASLIGKGALSAGDVVEVKYLYASADGRLTQPTILRRRTDKAPDACSTNQLRFVNKGVLA